MDNPKKDAGEAEMLPPPPPVVPPNFVPQKVGNRVPMTRRGVATTGTSITLKVNHFKVAYERAAYGREFQHHSIAIKHEDGSPVEVKTIWRKILNKLLETYATFNNFAYDGHTSLFTTGFFPTKANRDFNVVLDDETTQNRNIGSGSPGADGSPNDTDRKRLRREHASKTYTVSLKFTASIPIEAIGYGPIPVRGIYSEHFQEAVRVLNIILRHHAAQRGCLLVRQSFFHNNDRNFVDLGCGVLVCRGFHSSIRPTQGGLSLNMDISTTMIVKPGPLLDFLLFNQEVDDAAQLDWIKAKKTLKNLRVKVSSSNMEYKISGLSDLRCREQTFLFKQRSGASEAQEKEITVYNYFTQHRNIELEYSSEMPCVNVGKPKRPTYFPIKLCSLVPLQRYTKSLSNRQRASLVEKSQLRPKDIVLALERGPTVKDYVADPFIRSCEVRISTELTQVQGRVLAPPKLRVGSGEDLSPSTGRWNFNQKSLVMVKYIPPEIMEKILSRLPVKSLLRFKSVCKSWNALISSHPFIRTHLLHSSHRALFIQEYSFFFRKRNLFRFQDRQFDVHLPPAGNHNFSQWCSCDGILLLEDTSKYPLKRGDLFLWNPSMRKITKLFLPNFSSPMEPLYLYGCKIKPFHSFKDYWCNIYGLCYDPATVDLKVVAFYGDNNYSVYSCKNKCWSKEHGVIAHDIMYSIYARDAVCVGGALYWIICGNYFGTKLCGDLLCFESDGDKLKKVQRPGDLKERDVFCLISLRGRLCVWCCSAGESVVRIWMRMREEGEEVWRDFMRMEDIPHPYSHYYPYPLYVDVDVEENEITVGLQSSRGIMVYHSREKSFEEFDLPRTEKPSEFDEATHTKVTDLFSSVDSLLFFDPHPPPLELPFN